MKASAIDKIVAGLRAEQAMLDGLIHDFAQSTSPLDDMRAKSDMLGHFIARLVAPESAPAPKERKARTKKADKPKDVPF